MVIYGVSNGYDDFENMAYFFRQKESYFKKLLLIEKTPSHDCLSDLFSMIDAKEFMNIFIDWVKTVVEQRTGATIAIDGKAVKSARDKINGGNTPYILSAYLTEIGISIGQVEVNKKSNEIKSYFEYWHRKERKYKNANNKSTRNHWNIECGLRWRLDVILNEDHSRNRVKNSISNLSIIRKIVFNLVRLDTSSGKISFEKKMTRYKTDFADIENLIFNILPLLVYPDSY